MQARRQDRQLPIPTDQVVTHRPTPGHHSAADKCTTRPLHRTTGAAPGVRRPAWRGPTVADVTWWRGARAWLRAHPTPADALLAILVIGPAFGGRVNALPGPPIAPTVPSQLLVVASCLTLVLRRRYPTVVWGATLTLGVAVVLLQHGPSPALLPLLVALYTLASRWPVPRALLAAFGSAGLLLVAQSFAT